MTSILEDLFFGNIDFNFATRIRDEKYRVAMDTVDRNQEVLLELLSGKEKTLFLDMVNALSTTDAAESVNHFSNGFRFGARLMLEVMAEEEHCTIE